jgi:chromosome partitioning protein
VTEHQEHRVDMHASTGTGPGYAGPVARSAGTGRATIVAVANQKGGVGKTTTTVSLGAALAQGGARVLLVDLDPQGNASTGLDVRITSDEASTYDAIVEGLPIAQAIRRTAVEGLSVLPSSLELAGAEVELVQAMARERALARAVEPARGDHDVILIDCPPSLGLLTINAFVAADQLLVPIQCEYYALEGLTQLMRTVGLVEENLNPGLSIGNVVLTMFDGRTKLSQQVVDEVREFFGPRAFATIIPRTVRLSEAPSYAQPITVFDPESRGAEAYLDLAAEFAVRLGLTMYDGARAAKVAAATKAAEIAAENAALEAQRATDAERGDA